MAFSRQFGFFQKMKKVSRCIHNSQEVPRAPCHCTHKANKVSCTCDVLKLVNALKKHHSQKFCEKKGNSLFSIEHCSEGKPHIFTEKNRSNLLNALECRLNTSIQSLKRNHPDWDILDRLIKPSGKLTLCKTHQNALCGNYVLSCAGRLVLKEHFDKHICMNKETYYRVSRSNMSALSTDYYASLSYHPLCPGCLKTYNIMCNTLISDFGYISDHLLSSFGVYTLTYIFIFIIHILPYRTINTLAVNAGCDSLLKVLDRLGCGQQALADLPPNSEKYRLLVEARNAIVRSMLQKIQYDHENHYNGDCDSVNPVPVGEFADLFQDTSKADFYTMKRKSKTTATHVFSCSMPSYPDIRRAIRDEVTANTDILDCVGDGLAFRVQDPFWGLRVKHTEFGDEVFLKYMAPFKHQGGSYTITCICRSKLASVALSIAMLTLLLICCGLK